MDRFIIIYFITVNIVTFAAYGIDKRKAVKGRWRISEKTLLLLGLSGGSIGQLAGMKFFHHKTGKWYFRLSAIAFLLLHFVIFYIYLTNWKFLLT